MPQESCSRHEHNHKTIRLQADNILAYRSMHRSFRFLSGLLLWILPYSTTFESDTPYSTSLYRRRTQYRSQRTKHETKRRHTADYHISPSAHALPADSNSTLYH